MRKGLTITELLVAITITVTLSVMAAAALFPLFKARRQEYAHADVRTLNKLYQDKRVLLLDKLSAEEVPHNVIAWCDNDVKLATAVWYAMRIREEFPVTYEDATTQVVLGAYRHPVRFADLPPAANAFAESSVLLSRVLEEHQVRCTDQWGGPIGVRVVVTTDHRDVVKNWAPTRLDQQVVRNQLLQYTRNRVTTVLSLGKDGVPSSDDLIGLE